MKKPELVIRNAEPSEFQPIGNLMVAVYSQLDGFPKPSEQPAYYDLLLNIGDFTHKPETELLVAIADEKIVGAVVYFNDL